MFKCLDFKCLCVGQNIHTNKECKFQQISYSIVILRKSEFIRNGTQKPFHTVWNGFCIPFHKKICNSFYETKYRIRFCMYETDSVFRFIKKIANFFLKRNTESVSVCKFFYETEYRIRFIHTETDSVFRFIKKFAIFFMKRNTESVSVCMKRILYSVS